MVRENIGLQNTYLKELASGLVLRNTGFASESHRLTEVSCGSVLLATKIYFPKSFQ